MTEPPRRRFQIHLSTAILLSLAAGGLLWANLTPQVFTTRRGKFGGMEWIDEAHRNYGWPQRAFLQMDMPDDHTTLFEWKDAAFDAGVAALILFAVWFAGQWWACRRAPIGAGLHRGTVWLLIVAAGAMLWANLWADAPPIKPTHGPPHDELELNGWPFDAWATVFPYIDGFKPYRRILHRGALLDFLIAIAILFVLGYACEKWLRRRARSNV